MSALTELKRRMIPVMHDCALEYEKRLRDRHTLIICDDGFTIDVLWRKDCFMHLCGVKCNRPPKAVGRHAPGEAVFFYDMLLAGRLSPRDVVIPDGRLFRRKMEALPLLVHLTENDLLLVDARNENLALAAGDRRWMVGFAITQDAPSRMCEGNVMFPRTLQSRDVMKAARPDGVIRHVKTIRIIAQRDGMK